MCDNVLQTEYFVIHCITFQSSKMTSTDTTLSVRVSERIKKSAETQAKRNELSLSDVIRVLLKEYAQGKIRIKIEQDK